MILSENGRAAKTANAARKTMYGASLNNFLSATAGIISSFNRSFTASATV